MVNFDFASALVTKRVEMAMTSTVQILRGDLGGLDETTLLVTGLTNATTIYQGKAHIHSVNGAGIIPIGETNVDTRTVQISIPLTAPVPHRDDLVKVVNDGDPDLPNRIFRVMDLQAGGLLNAFHQMTCQGWFESRYWG